MIKTLTAAAAAFLFCHAAGAAGFTALDRAAARRLVDPAAHSRPTVIALWSSDCVHCKKNLRLLADLSRSSGPFQVVTVATEPESPDHAKMLDAAGIQGTRYAYGSDMPEALAYALDPAWRGELPRTLFLDGKGGRTAVSGVLDEAALRSRLGLTPR
ncbi:MAG: hypothetical protein H6R10_1824 [Rhodocyclaceae bacterium]|nr:hypothetical protein [Rhodocyclaceae bacterium]